MIKLKYPLFWSHKSWLSYILKPFSWIYILLSYLRLKFTTQVKLPQLVVCIGNITVGGAGKTQLVAHLAKILKQQKISFVIVTKAYQSKLKDVAYVSSSSKPIDVGDESILLSKCGPVIATKRLSSSFTLIKQINPQVVILDDGMQNPQLYKDLQILVFDSKQNIGNNCIFPSGPLRQSLAKGLKIADIIFMLGNDNSSDFNLINKINSSEKPFFKARISLEYKHNYTMQYIAFAGIGNPAKFYTLLKSKGLNLIEEISFEDHYHYTDKDLKQLFDLAKHRNCQLITTEKDFVKIPDYYKNNIICANVILKVENEKIFKNLFFEIVTKNF